MTNQKKRIQDEVHKWEKTCQAIINIEVINIAHQLNTNGKSEKKEHRMKYVSGKKKTCNYRHLSDKHCQSIITVTNQKERIQDEISK